MYNKNNNVVLSNFYSNQIHTRKFSDKLGRYYTPLFVAEVLCELIGQIENKNIIDLGCGNGNLIYGSFKNWKDCIYHAYDIDPIAIKELEKNKNDNILTYNMDVLTGGIAKESFDIGLTNPPYVYLNKEKIKNHLENNTNFETELLKLNRIPAPLIFLAKILNSVKKNGKIGVIFPNGLLVNRAYKRIREALIKEYKIKILVKLEPYVFEKTETYAHLLIIENNKPEANYPIQFYELKGKKLTNPALRSNVACNDRLDYYINENKKDHILGDHIKTIFRGRVSSKEIKENPNLEIFHTTDFNKNNSRLISGTIKKNKDLTKKYAKKGDILIARVGRNFFKKIKIVKNNFIEVSDSIIIIRPQPQKTELIYKILTNSEIQEYLHKTSKGTGAKYITHSQIINLPIKKELLNVI